MLAPRILLQKSCCFQYGARTKNSLLWFRPLHGTKSRGQRFPGLWLSNASNFIYTKSEIVLRYSYEKLGGFVQAFDDLVGISDVQDAQTSVKKAENEFMTTRGQVQSARTSLSSVQEKLKEVRRKLDRIPRDDERYLALATEEHRILVEEKKIKSEYEHLEALERDQFALLSGAVRDSHERERARAERTKHWSVIGSVGGAVLGKNSSLKFPFSLGGVIFYFSLLKPCSIFGPVLGWNYEIMTVTRWDGGWEGGGGAGRVCQGSKQNF